MGCPNFVQVIISQRIFKAPSKVHFADRHFDSDGASGQGSDGKGQIPYHGMIKRINELESRLAVLDNPNQKEVNEDTMIIKEHGGKGRKPVSDMWTLIQTQRRSQSNEEMISKV